MLRPLRPRSARSRRVLAVAILSPWASNSTSVIALSCFMPPEQRAVARVPDRAAAVGAPGGDEAPARSECDGDDPARRPDASRTRGPRPRVPEPERAIRTRRGEERPGRIESDREREASVIERLDTFAVRASQILIRRVAHRRRDEPSVGRERGIAHAARVRQRRDELARRNVVGTHRAVCRGDEHEPSGRCERDLRDRLVAPPPSSVERPAVRHAPEHGAAVVAAGQRDAPRRGDGQRRDRGVLIERADDRPVPHARHERTAGVAAGDEQPVPGDGSAATSGPEDLTTARSRLASSARRNASSAADPGTRRAASAARSRLSSGSSASVVAARPRAHAQSRAAPPRGRYRARSLPRPPRHRRGRTRTARRRRASRGADGGGGPPRGHARRRARARAGRARRAPPPRGRRGRSRIRPPSSRRTMRWSDSDPRTGATSASGTPAYSARSAACWAILAPDGVTRWLNSREAMSCCAGCSAARARSRWSATIRLLPPSRSSVAMRSSSPPAPRSISQSRCITSWRNGASIRADPLADAAPARHRSAVMRPTATSSSTRSTSSRLDRHPSARRATAGARAGRGSPARRHAGRGDRAGGSCRGCSGSAP